VTSAGPFRVALTFDAEHPDRPSAPGVQERLLDGLAGFAVRATFFVQGRWAEAYPATARRIPAEGHLVGNHSHYHARMPQLNSPGLAWDIKTAEENIIAITGVDPRPWFRNPFGAGSDDPRVLKAIERVHQGEVWLDRATTGRIFLELSRAGTGWRAHAPRKEPALLTARERELIGELAANVGANYRTIAGKLRISERTVRNHLTHIYRKLGVQNRGELLAYASKKRILPRS